MIGGPALSIPRTDRADAAVGRRIYVHSESFAHLATQSEEIANRLFFSINAVVAIKIMYDHIGDAMMLDVIADEVGTGLQIEFQRQWYGELTGFFRSLGFRIRDPHLRDDFLALLDTNEDIAGSCSEAGYLTFATDQHAADRMYLDHEPLRALRAACAMGAGPADLTLIHGRALAPIDESVGTGRGKGPHYRAQLRRRSVTPERFDSLQTAAVEGIVSDASDTLRKNLGLTDLNDTRFASEAMAAMTRALAASRLRYPG